LHHRNCSRGRPGPLRSREKSGRAVRPLYYYAGYACAKEGKLEDARKMFAEAEKINLFDYNNYIYQGRVSEGNKDLQKLLNIIKRLLRSFFTATEQSFQNP
jgi:hypothetical protein